MKKSSFRRLIALLTALALLCALAACGGKTPAGTDETTTEGTQNLANVPTGLWALTYIGNENGEYVEEFNVVEGFDGKPVNFMEIATLDYGEISYFDLDENGEGVLREYSKDPRSVKFDAEKLTFDDGTEIPYVRDGDRLWYEDEPGFFCVMLNVTQAEYERILRGAYDCKLLKDAQIGDLVALGTYDTAPGNDKTEVIKWRVIDKDGDKLLILCDQLIDSFCYHNEEKGGVLETMSWQDSTVRAFLNGDFLTCCFTEEEIALIETTHLKNEGLNDVLENLWRNVEDKGEATYSELKDQDLPDGPETDDKVFLLSVDEVLKYFGDETAPDPDQSEDNYPFSVIDTYPKAIAYVTKAVQDNHEGYYDRETNGGAWMTRTLSVGSHRNTLVTYVSGSGHFFNYFTNTPMFIRPAMWVRAE